MRAHALLFTLLLAFTVPTWAEQYRSRLVDEGDLLSDITPPSPENIEQNLSGIDDPQEKSNTQRYLAGHFIAQKQYGKAISFYEQALANNATSPDARRQMLGELATLYVIDKRYEQAANTLQRYRQQGGREHETLEFAIAQQQYRQGQIAAAAASFDRGLLLLDTPTNEQLNSALSLNYRAGNLKRCTEILKQLISREPDKLEHWRNITGLFIRAKDNRSALNYWLLAFEKHLPLTERDLLLLTDLMAAENNPDRAARLLEAALTGGHVSADNRNYQRLASYWQRARQPDKAASAALNASRNNNDPEMKLYLARLHMEKEEWQAMQQQVLEACRKPLPQNLVSRANLLLGVSQLKLGDNESARRSLINATIYGGAVDEAGKWLRYIKAEPASRRESLRVSGPCTGN